MPRRDRPRLCCAGYRSCLMPPVHPGSARLRTTAGSHNTHRHATPAGAGPRRSPSRRRCPRTCRTDAWTPRYGTYPRTRSTLAAAPVQPYSQYSCSAEPSGRLRTGRTAAVLAIRRSRHKARTWVGVKARAFARQRSRPRSSPTADRRRARGPANSAALLGFCHTRELLVGTRRASHRSLRGRACIHCPLRP